jgi:hypothetical protein
VIQTKPFGLSKKKDIYKHRVKTFKIYNGKKTGIEFESTILCVNLFTEGRRRMVKCLKIF